MCVCLDDGERVRRETDTENYRDWLHAGGLNGALSQFLEVYRLVQGQLESKD